MVFTIQFQKALCVFTDLCSSDAVMI